jgi:WD40 repeat protein
MTNSEMPGTKINCGGALLKLSIAPNGCLVGLINGSIHIWDPQNVDQPSRSFLTEDKSIAQMQFGFFSNSDIITLGRDNSICVWNFSTGELVCRSTHESIIMYFHVLPDDQLVVINYDNNLYLWE